MKRIFHNLPGALAVLLTVLHQASTGFAQSSAFSYQGRLLAGGSPATGTFDLRFKLYADSLGNTQVGSTFLTNAVDVSNGLFIVVLDFGNQFPGANRWLGVDVKTNGGPGYTTLSPLQPVTPTPYAITAANLSGSIATTQLPPGVVTNNASGLNLTGNFTGTGANLTNVNAATLGGLSSAGFWRTNGNSGANPTNGAFLGTTDNLPLEFKVNGTRALRLEPTSNNLANVIGGFASNLVSPGVLGGTIAGGGGAEWFGPTPPQTIGESYATIGGGIGNVVQASVATVAGGERAFIDSNAYNAFIGGGAYNSISSADSAISGGRGNTISSNAYYATISGGVGNTISTNGYYAAIGGGYANTISTNGYFATIGGGAENISSGYGATVPGGSFNTAGGDYSFAAGLQARANHQGAFVWADSQSLDFASTGNDQFLVRASGGVGLYSSAVKVGANAQYYVPGGEQNLRLIRGVISSTGTILSGSGFTVAHPGTGMYTVTFTSSFNDTPTITATVQSGLSRLITSTSVGAGSAQFRTFVSSNEAPADLQFHFIAIGTR